MKQKITILLIFVSALMTLHAVTPPAGSFTWNKPAPIYIDYQASDTLNVTSTTITQFSVTYTLKDTSLAQYVSLNGNVVTVLKCYSGTSEQSKDSIIVQAHISGMTQYDDIVIETNIKTRKIYPSINWTCTINDMLCGSSVHLSATHTNTDRPQMQLTFNAVDNISNPSAKVDIDQTTDMMKAVAVGSGIYVEAKIDSTDNFKATTVAYMSNDSIVRFNVVKGFRNISWDSTDFRNINNFSGDVPLKLTYEDPEDPCTVLSDDPLVADVMPGNILHVYKEGQVKLTATVSDNDNYYTASSDTTITIAAVAPTIAWEEDFIKNTEDYALVNSTTYDYPLTWWVNSNYDDDAEFHFSIPSDQSDIAKVVDDTLLWCYGIGEFTLNAYAKSVGGTSSTITRTFKLVKGTLQFINAGNWNDSSCWSRSDLLQSLSDFDIEVVNKCQVPSGVVAECQNLTIYANGNMTLEPGATLIVNDTLENYGGTGTLYLKANKDSAASVILGAGSPEATVEMYLRHSQRPGVDTVWCSNGLPVDSAVLKSSTGHLVVRQWNESKGKFESTYMFSPGYKATLSGWRGYYISDTLSNIYAVEGKLLSGDKQFSLTKTSTGLNFITNSYAAPVAMSALNFENMNSELFYFNGAQYQTLPKYTAYTLGSGDWNPGASLFAYAKSAESKVVIDYEKAVAAAPVDKSYNMLRVNVSDNKGNSDVVSLLAADNCSSDFEDGYDGTKLEGKYGLPMIYASNKWGKASVNVDQSIVGQSLGFTAGTGGEQYTISFDTHALSGYDQLYLFDTKTQQFTDIIAGETYSFTGSTLGENDRFTIMRDKVEQKKDKYGRCIVVMGRKVLLVGFENSNSIVRVMNLEGKIICQYNAQDGPWFELPELVTGIYLINADQCNTKFYR